MSSLKALFAAVFMGSVGLMAGCGGGGGGSSGTPPPAPTLSSIAVTPAPASVAAGATVQFVATGTYSDHTTATITSTVTWTSATASAATISASGLATGVAVGSSAITAALSGVTSSAVTLTVTAPLLKSIAVTAAASSFAAGTTSQLTATGTYGDGSTAALTTGVTWTSATPSVATINASGLATGVAAGTAAVTAVVGTVTSTAVTLTVTPPALVSIAITPPAPHILVNGGTTQLTAIGSYANNTTATITTSVSWSSATAATATIGATTGLATLATPAPAVGATTVVTASSGGITSNPLTLTVSPAEFALVTNFTDATVSQYYVAGNGVLTPQTPPTITTTPLTGMAAATVWPFVVVVDPTASFAYVANYGANGESIAQYTIDKTTGLLTANGPNIATGTGPNGLAIFPSAANPSPSPYLYSVNINEHGAPYAHAISEFEYNSSGVLSDNPTAPFVAVTPPMGAAAGAPDPASIAIVNGALGAYAYIADFTGPGRASYITEYSVGSNGVLAPLSTPSIASGEQPNNIVVSPNGYVYAVNNSDGSVSQYSIGTGGQLAPLSPATVAASPGSESIAFNPAGTYAYVANCPLVNGAPVADGSVSEFSVASTGVLTLIGTQSANLNVCPSFLTVDPSGQFLYVTNRGINQATVPPYGTTVSEFLIGGNGTLTPLSVGTVATGNQPTGIVVFSE